MKINKKQSKRQNVSAWFDANTTIDYVVNEKDESFYIKSALVLMLKQAFNI